MKKMIIALAVTLSFHLAQSQIYLGWSKVEILSERTAAEEVRKDSLSDGTQYLSFIYVDTTHYTRRYFFDKETKKCNLYVVEPSGEDALNAFVKFCNESYKPVGAKRWVTQVANFKVDISLEHGAFSGNHYFCFERRK